MQKPKPIEYVQAILYLIKYHWRIIVTTILAIATIILGLSYACTGNKICYYWGVGTGLCAVIICCVIYIPEISRKLDELGLNITPEDEK